jgi:PAS domain S-box-containing protein
LGGCWTAATGDAPRAARVPDRGGDMTGPNHAEEGNDLGLVLSAVEFSWDSIITATVEGVITSWNPAAERVFGYTKGEIIGKPSSLLSPNDRVDETRTALARLRTGQPVENLETFRVRRDGTVFPVWVTAAPILDENGAVVGVTAIHRDVTEMNQAFETAQRMTSIVEHSDHAIYGRTLEGVITSWNPAAERMYGYMRQEVVGQSIDLLIGVDRSEELRSILARIRAGEHLEHFETIRVRKDGTFFPVSLTISPIHDRDGSVVGVSTIARDMSERRKATENGRIVATQENMLNTVMRSASIGIVLAGTDGSIQVVNRSMCDLLGYDEAWFLAHRLRDLVHPDEVEKGARDRARLIDGSKDPLATKVRLVRSDGATIWVSRAMVVIPGQDGKPDLLLVQARDITAEHAALQALA